MLRGEPLSNHNLLLSHDSAETQEKLSHLMWPHHMQARPGLMHSRVDGVPLANMGLYYLRYGVDVSIDTGEVRDYYLLQVALSGRARITSGSNEIDTGPGSTTMISPQAGMKIRMNADSSYLVVMLKRQALERQLAGLLDVDVMQPLQFDLSLSRPDKIHALQNYLACICAQYNDDAFLLDLARVNDHFSATLFALLLYTWRHNYTEHLVETTPRPLPGYLCRARAIIRENLASPLSVKTLAREVNVTPRTLQNAFNHFLHTRPHSYIQNLRMQAAHEALLAADPQRESVTEIAMKHGINDMGRFAKRYKNRFGVLPSQTLRERDRESA